MWHQTRCVALRMQAMGREERFKAKTAYLNIFDLYCKHSPFENYLRLKSSRSCWSMLVLCICPCFKFSDDLELLQLTFLDLP